MRSATADDWRPFFKKKSGSCPWRQVRFAVLCEHPLAACDGLGSDEKRECLNSETPFSFNRCMLPD
jgi:hypothetical protein